ncbi:MAG: amidohydrolase, partial [Cyclobacteriaceae bacterium]|nr:amidohydrolase [Cyclobacteriaceae bacterium]
MKKLLLYCTVAFISIAGRSQTTFPGNGVPDDRPSTYAFTNATIFQDYQTRLEKATLLIRDGRVVAVGTQVSIPAGTPTYDLRGRYIYPAFIDPYTSYGLPEAKSGGGGFGAPQYET